MKISFSLFLLSTLLLAGCASTPTTVDKGTIHATTFNFVIPRSKTVPSFVDNSDALHRMIQTAITKNLEARGVKRVASGGDITIPYLIIAGNHATTTTISNYFGYSEDLGGLQDKAHTAYTSNKSPNHFKAGTLLIDIMDNKTLKVLRRGYATRPVLDGISQSARAERIQQVVDEILNPVKITP